MIKESKQPNHVLGKKTNCPNFTQCAICFGCRSYSTSVIECEKCTVNRKRDICNRELHRADLVNKLISKNEIKFDEAIFISSDLKEE